MSSSYQRASRYARLKFIEEETKNIRRELDKCDEIDEETEAGDKSLSEQAHQCALEIKAYALERGVDMGGFTIGQIIEKTLIAELKICEKMVQESSNLSQLLVKLQKRRKSL